MYSLDLLAQSQTSSTWLTTMWLVSLGVAVGFLLCIVLLGIGFGLSRIPGLNTIFDKPGKRFTVAAILTGIIAAACYPLYAYAFDLFSEQAGETIGKFSELLLFTIPPIFIFSVSVLALCSKQFMSEIVDIIKDGPLYWLSVICISMTVFCVTGIVLHLFDGFGTVWFIDDAEGQWESLVEYPSHMFPKRHKLVWEKTGKTDENGVDEGLKDLVLDFKYDSEEIKEFVVICKNPLRFSVDHEFGSLDPSTIGFGTDGRKKRETFKQHVFPRDKFEKLHVKNLEIKKGENVTANITIATMPLYPQVKAVYITAVFVLFVFLLYIFQRSTMPKVSAICVSTFKTELAQPLFRALLIIGSVVLISFEVIPGYTLGEDIKILKDSGLTIIIIFTIFMAIFAASKSLAEEIEGRTALTVLSKPIGRRQFILGKFFGISWSVALMFIVLGIVFAFCVAYKPIYDSREGAQGAVDWTKCFQETMRIVPGLFLGYMEVLVFVAIGIVISTRLPIMANLMICLTIYVLGHLTPLMVQSSVAVDAFEPVVFIGQLIAVILPVLDHFNIQAAVSGNTDVPFVYLCWSTVYCIIYGTIALLFALIFFEDRDLA